VFSRKRLLVAGSLAAVAALSLAATAESDAPVEDPKSLVLALVPSQDQGALVDTAAPLTDFLTEELGIEVTGVVSKDYQASVEAMGAGQA